MALTEEEKRKAAEKERKKAEVRARLEEAARAKKGKKGFMTPERKRKLRTLLRKNAAEAVKREQERRAGERREMLLKRCGQAKNLDGLNADALKKVCQEYHDRLAKLEDNKYDLECEVRQKDYLINELQVQVNDMRGKFLKPALKKVSKYDQKLEKMAKVAAKADQDFRQNLKRVQSTKFTVEDEKDMKDQPNWAKKGGHKLEVEEAEEEE
ncbi:troponin wings up A [Dermatophagoides pteronyssinus]|uniref:Troponin I-like n=2 Tax=Dermatophagoides pteronyssinus TaxID=6956 RepID=A0A6P6YBY6_DERPT|nr:troponin I-like [Dermatophagoides pteronyssinus]KAH9415404.1 Troponin I, slow skeletal muscle [Dermatophagoides pteronyssinus]